MRKRYADRQMESAAATATATVTAMITQPWLPDFIDPVLQEAELPPYLQPADCDSTLLEITSMLSESERNSTLACARQAARLNFSSTETESGVGIEEHCAKLFALTARLLAQNATIINSTVDPLSMYSLPSKVLIMSATVIASLVTVLGNAMVLASFVIERSLRQATNYFIASLAVTDLLIGLFSMNFFSLYLILDNHWPLGDIICDLWLSLDFTVCLASQYTVFFITVDRFCSVKLPAKYRSWRSDRKVLWMVLGCWIIPTAVFFPIILGWPFFNRRQRLNHQCEAEFIWDPWLTLWLTVGYYWITLVAMTSLYVVIYRVAVQMSKKADEKRKRVSAVFQLAENSVVRLQVCMTQNLNVPDGHLHSHVEKTERESKRGTEVNLTSISNSNSHKKPAVVVSVTSAARTSSASRSSHCDSLFEDSENEHEHEHDDEHNAASALSRAIRETVNQQVCTISATQIAHTKGSVSTNVTGNSQSQREKRTRFSSETSRSKFSFCRQMSQSHDVDCDKDSGTILSSNDGRRESKMTQNLKFSRFQALAKRVSAGRKKIDTQQSQKAENRAKKALKTITFILGCFVACWTPYHVVVLIDSFAKLWSGEPIVNVYVYNFCYWLCYINSPINPFCYAFVNIQFKKAFLRILKCDWTVK